MMARYYVWPTGHNIMIVTASNKDDAARVARDLLGMGRLPNNTMIIPVPTNGI